MKRIQVQRGTRQQGMLLSGPFQMARSQRSFLALQDRAIGRRKWFTWGPSGVQFRLESLHDR